MNHQFHDLGIIADLFVIVGVSRGLELDGTSLALLTLISTEFTEAFDSGFTTYLESVCLQGRVEVLRVCADDDFVDFEVVRSTEDCAVGVFFTCEVSCAEVSIWLY